MEEAPQPSQTDDLRDKIISQVEYYLSDENLRIDKHLMNYLTKDKEGFVPVEVIATLRKMKKLTLDRSIIVAALRESSLLVLSSDGKKVKRLHPLPFTEVKDPKACTVLVENLPEDHSTENMQRIFGEAGNIKNICIRDPDVRREPRKRTIAEKLLSGKLHALVEYETVEAADKAVATLKDEQDWRYGMRVKLLKHRAKHGEGKRGGNGSDSEKNSSVKFSESAMAEEDQVLSEHCDDTLDERNDEHLGKEKNGHKVRKLGRETRQKYRGSNRHEKNKNKIRPWKTCFKHAGETSNLPPAPRMPDGTRGFTMGRGRPLASDEN